MEIKLIDNPVKLAEFLNNPVNTGNIVDSGDKYYIKPDAVYLGIYEGLVLAGVHEVRNFWHSVVECHAVYGPDSVANMHYKGIDYSANGFSKTHHSLTASPWFLTPPNTDGQLSVCLALPVLVTLMMRT